MSRKASVLSLSKSLKQGISPLMILQKMHEAILDDIGEDTNVMGAGNCAALVLGMYANGCHEKVPRQKHMKLQVVLLASSLEVVVPPQAPARQAPAEG